MNWLKEVSIVFVGGALGGIVSVMDAWTDPVFYPLSIVKVLTLFVIPFVKGGVAAGIAVYVLTSLDQTHLVKAFFFAVACGLAFPSILTKGGSMADSVTSQVAKQTIEENASKIALMASTGSDNKAVNVQDIKSAATTIIKAEQKVKEGDKREAESALQQAISTLSRKATQGDTTALQAITDIATFSTTQGLRSPTETAIRELKMIQANPNLPDEYRSKAQLAVSGLEKPRM
jgi:ribosomal protein S20